MRLRIVSDLHLELYGEDLHAAAPGKIFPPLEDIDALLLAGDIIVLTDPMIAWLRDYLGDRPFKTYYVLGNHELYNQDYTEARARAKAGFAGTNIQVLDNETVQIGAARLIGSTLWTDYKSGGELSQVVSNLKLMDCRMIRQDDGPFTAERSVKEHNIARRYLEEQLALPHDGPTIVMTHHAPSITYGQHPDYESSILTGAFCSDLEYLFDRVDLWIWGHTHASQDVRIGRTRLVSNQRGYPNETPVRGFAPDLTVEI